MVVVIHASVTASSLSVVTPVSPAQLCWLLLEQREVSSFPLRSSIHDQNVVLCCRASGPSGECPRVPWGGVGPGWGGVSRAAGMCSLRRLLVQTCR